MKKQRKMLAMACAVAIFSAAAAAAAAKDKATPVSPIGDQGSWFPLDSYPLEAKRKGEQGRVSVVLSVDATGRPTDCAIASSSGSAALDDGTCKLAMANARFNPARDNRGKPIESLFWLRGVRWMLGGDSQGMDLSGGPGMLTLNNIEVDLDERGYAIACRPLSSIAVGDRGCEQFKPGQIVIPPPMRNGKPTRSKVTITTTMRVVPE